MPLFFAMLLLLFWSPTVSTGSLPGEALLTALQRQGARVSEVRLNLYAVDDRHFRSGRSLADELARAGIHGPYSVQLEPFFHRVAAGGGTRWVLESVRLTGLRPGAETLLVADAVVGPGSLATAEERLAGTFRRLGLRPRIEVTVRGSRPGRLDRFRRRKLVAEIIRSLGGRPVEGVSGRDLTSVAAYAPGLGPVVLAAGRPLNLQVAISYNGYARRTEIILGSPLIAISY